MHRPGLTRQLLQCRGENGHLHGWQGQSHDVGDGSMSTQYPPELWLIIAVVIILGVGLALLASRGR